jgi:hypothetical protein
MVERQRCAIEFCVRLGKSESETPQVIDEAYGDDAMRRAAIFKWLKRFRDGETNVKVESRSDQEVKTICSTILLKLVANGLQQVFESGWSVIRSASLARGGTSKKRLSPHLHKDPTRNNKLSPRNFETALFIFAACL